MHIMEIFRQIESENNGRLHGKITWIIAGLGNPGLTYENTRHNAGFMALQKLADNYNVSLNRMQFQADCGEAMFGETRVLLMKPTTYMNRSGDAIAAAVHFYKIEPSHVLVFYDDISLSPGKLRIRQKGSAGGHNGMKSILAQLGTEVFPRIRIGVGAKPQPQMDLADWVLSKFTADEQIALSRAIDNTVQAAKLIVDGDINRAMNMYNG